MITVLYFARLRETFGTGSENIALPAGVQNLEGLVDHFVETPMAVGDTEVADGDEIAFFPPVTGG